MRTYDKKINDILNIRNSKLIVPNNQRNYEWQTKECKKLISDILEYAEENTYWIGFIMTKTTTFGDLKISDGQQRIATFSLMYLAIRNVISSTKKFSQNEELHSFAEEIYQTYIIDRFSKNSNYQTKNRLILREEDNITYEDIIENNGIYSPKNNLIKNYNFFINFFKKMTIDEILKLKNIFENVVVTQAYIEAEDNEFLVFQTLNGTGKELSGGEIIKNTLFNELLRKYKTDKFKKNELEEKVKEIEINSLRDIDACLQYWYYVNTNKWVTSRKRQKFIDEITKYIKNNGVDNTIISMYNFSKIYRQVLTLSYEDNTINSFLKKTIRQNDNFNILIFDVICNNNLNTDEKIKILKIGENIFFRKWVCGHSFLYNTFIGMLRKSLEKEGDKIINFIETIQERPGSDWGPTIETAIPNDDVFINKLMTNDIYRSNSVQWRKYIFNAIENSIHDTDTKEYIDIYGMMNSDKTTIEHIIPQTITEEWKMALGDYVNDIYDKYINTLPNLTITGYNSEYSNKTFLEKKTMKNGFSTSSFKINRQLCKYEQFGMKELLDRKQFLSEIALKRWSLPKIGIKKVG